MLFTSSSHILLIIAAAIWGGGFVAQSVGMDFLGPHSFNAARFLLGAMSLLPLWLLMGKKRLPQGKVLFIGGLVTGTITFGGFSFQQVGLLYTTAGNAGFITSMYVVMVPIVAAFMGQRIFTQTWIGIILVVLGVYRLSVGPNFSINYGDLLEFIGALFWTSNMIILGWLSRKVDAVSLTISQFLVATVWATIASMLYETPSLLDYQSAWIPLVYAGVASSGIAYTLQVIAQRKVESSVTALIVSTEAIFAVLGGWFLLDEKVGSKEILGCSLMLLGMLVSQWPKRKGRKIIYQDCKKSVSIIRRRRPI